MNKITEFLNKSGTFYLATIENNKPRVRPFGAVAEFEGKIYICTNNQKDVFTQILVNSNVEISSMVDDKWIRLEGKLSIDNREEAKKAMLEANPPLRSMYNENDGIFEVLYFTEATAKICSFTSEPDILYL